MSEADKQETEQPPSQERLGFLRGQLLVPDDFDEIGRAEIQRLFEGDEPEDTHDE